MSNKCVGILAEKFSFWILKKSDKIWTKTRVKLVFVCFLADQIRGAVLLEQVFK